MDGMIPSLRLMYVAKCAYVNSLRPMNLGKACSRDSYSIARNPSKDYNV
jgi:hypothetical protein